MRYLLVILISSASFAQTANLWIDSSGGTCTRSASLVAYNDAAACSNINTAVTAASAGDTVLMKAASYSGNQTISAVKSAPAVLVKCESATKYACTILGLTTWTGSNITLENVTIDAGDSCHDCSPLALTKPTNLTFRNVNLLGAFMANWWNGGTNILWDGGEVRSATRPSGAYSCVTADNEPFSVVSDGATNTVNGLTIRGITIWPTLVNPVFCGGDNFHVETFRLDGDLRNILFEKNIFKNGGQENTGTLFLTSFRSGFYGLPNPQAPTLRNNYFGSGTATATWQNNGACGVNFYYNTFNNGVVFTGCSGTGINFTGNAGMQQSSFNCVGTHVKNVSQWTSSYTCGTDTIVTGPQFSTSNLGLGGSDGYTVQTGSPLINAAESTCPLANNEDILGNPRPASTACDAGANEQASGGPPPSGPFPPTNLTGVAH